MNSTPNEPHQKKTDLNNAAPKVPALQGYRFSLVILTDLFCCIFVCFSIGLFLQKYFHTSPLLTAGLTILGGISGLYTAIRFAQQKKDSP